MRLVVSGDAFARQDGASVLAAGGLSRRVPVAAKLGAGVHNARAVPSQSAAPVDDCVVVSAQSSPSAQRGPDKDGGVALVQRHQRRV